MDPEEFAGPYDPDRNFSPVGDEDAGQQVELQLDVAVLLGGPEFALVLQRIK